MYGLWSQNLTTLLGSWIEQRGLGEKEGKLGMNRVGKARTADCFPPAFGKPCVAFTLPMKEKGLTKF